MTNPNAGGASVYRLEDYKRPHQPTYQPLQHFYHQLQLSDPHDRVKLLAMQMSLSSEEQEALEARAQTAPHNTLRDLEARAIELHKEGRIHLPK